MKLLNVEREHYKFKKKSLSLNEKENSANFRIYILFFLLFASASIITFRIYKLDVSAHSYYQELVDNQHSGFKKLVPKRGTIYIKDANALYPVAIDKSIKMAYAVPEEIENVDVVVNSLSDVLSLDKRKLQIKLSHKKDRYKVIKHRLTEDEIRSLKKLKLKGIHLTDEVYRYYPAQELASQVLGFVGWRGNKLAGRYGIENYFNAQLSGKPGRIYQTDNNWISTNNQKMDYAQDGDSLVLTLDHTIQYETEKMIQGAVNKFQAKRGSIIVMEPKTGKILAMAGYPNFNPNNYNTVENMGVFRNLAVSSPYECGSVFKTITAAAALDSKKITPATTYIDTGKVKSAGYTIQNSDFKVHGKQTMTQMLVKSLNTGAIYAEKLLGNRNFADYVKRFGFGKKTGIELPGENAGNINNLNNLRSNIQFYTASFGQGITVTPIQIISAYSAIANGGVLMKPQIVAKIIHANGKEEIIKPQRVRRVISQQASAQISQMLEKVVKGSEGKRAGVPGYLVGGKTGTAQVASSQKKGYEKGKTIGSFAGFAPVNNPQFAVIVRIDEPQTVEWAESSAAPTFGELMKFLLEYRNIKPTEKYTQKDWKIFNQWHNISNYFMQNNEDKKQNNEDEKTKKN
jgi:cell division protein FtsI/penicillin-binding protein 2